MSNPNGQPDLVPEYDQPLDEAVAVPPVLANEVNFQTASYQDVVRLADDPDNAMGMPEERINDALALASRRSNLDAAQGWRIVETASGGPHYAAEYDNVFSFDGQLRGKFDWVHKDQRTGAQQIAMAWGRLEGKFDMVCVETDADETVVIRRTSGNVQSAQKQTFELVSTRMMEQAGGAMPEPRRIDTNQLKGVLAIPGHQLHLREDPRSGKAPKTEGNITRIAAMDMSDKGQFTPSYHPRLKQADRYTDAREHINEAFRTARQRAAVAQVAGGVATRNT